MYALLPYILPSLYKLCLYSLHQTRGWREKREREVGKKRCMRYPRLQSQRSGCVWDLT